MTKPLDELIAALDERVRRLEERDPRPAPGGTPGGFWALDGLKERAPDGGVVFAGAVTLPTGEFYEWQHGAPADNLLADGADLAQLSPVLSALGHPVRLHILSLALSGTHAVSELQQVETMGTTGQLYHHVRLLVSAGWLHSTSRGHYAVPPERIIPLLAIVAAARR